jgi:hypothetical protein
MQALFFVNLMSRGHLQEKVNSTDFLNHLAKRYKILCDFNFLFSFFFFLYWLLLLFKKSELGTYFHKKVF